MADIDKSLPNEVRTEVEIPAEEVVEQEEIVEQGPVEVTLEEDGGATLNFEVVSSVRAIQMFRTSHLRTRKKILSRERL